MARFFGDFRTSTGENNSFLQSGPDFNVGLRYRILNDLAARVDVSFGTIKPKDNIDQTVGSKLFFFEPSLTCEYYFIKNKVESSYTLKGATKGQNQSFLSSLDFYAFTGIGVLTYDPNRNSASSLPAKSTAVIPFGTGFNFSPHGAYKLGVEFGGRNALSDILDGYYSPLSRSHDMYYFLNFTFTYKIRTARI